jgi:hypothetical protein
MNGQAKALIPALIGIITLLLTGITGMQLVPGEQQTISIAETRAITLEAKSRQTLGTAISDAANAAALQTQIDVAADLAVALKSNPPTLFAHQER